jgi:hypothetical protein
VKIVIGICALAGALYVGSQYERRRAATTAEQSRDAGETKEFAGVNPQRQGGTQEPQQPTPKANWVQDRNQNWKSSLSRGAYDRQHAVTIAPAPVIIVAPPVERPSLGFNRPPPANGPSGVRVPPAPPGARRSPPSPPPAGPPLARPQAPPPQTAPPTGN